MGRRRSFGRVHLVGYCWLPQRQPRRRRENTDGLRRKARRLLARTLQNCDRQVRNRCGRQRRNLSLHHEAEAEQAANDKEAEVRAGAWRDPMAGRITFGSYVNRWYPAQDLAASTMQIYRHHIEGNLLPTFGDMAIADILASDVAAWEKQQRTAGYAESGIRGRRKVLHLILADAVEERLRASNPATRRRGRVGAPADRRAGRRKRWSRPRWGFS